MLCLNSLVAFDLQAKSIGGKSLDKKKYSETVCAVVNQLGAPEAKAEKEILLCKKPCLYCRWGRMEGTKRW